MSKITRDDRPVYDYKLGKLGVFAATDNRLGILYGWARAPEDVATFAAFLAAVATEVMGGLSWADALEQVYKGWDDDDAS